MLVAEPEGKLLVYSTI